jgi:hypothetical protein
MKGKLMALCVLTLVAIPALSATANEIDKLYKNTNGPIITGPIDGIIGVVYEYEITYADPQGDDVYYEIRWGDCAVIFNADPFKSGEEVTFSHAWCSVCTGPGTFTILVMASDGNGDNSQWGALDVQMRGIKEIGLNDLVLYHILEKLIGWFPILGNLFDF